MPDVVSIDGRIHKPEEATVNVFDHGLLYGDGVFEGIRIIDGGILLLDEHVERLYASAQAIRLAVNRTPKEMKHDILNAVRQSGIADGYIRLVLTRGIGDLGLNPRRCPHSRTIIIVASIALYPEELYEQGLDVAVCNTRKTTATQLTGRAKSCNYLNNIQAVWDYLDQGCHEGLMLTPDGYVSEATADNVFGIRGDVLFTPSLDTNCLPGITRAQILRIAAETSFRVEEGHYRAEDFIQADEVFLTGTGAGIIAVAKLDAKTVGSGTMGPKTRQLRAEYERQVPSMCTPVSMEQPPHDTSRLEKEVQPPQITAKQEA